MEILLDTSAYSAFRRGHPRIAELVRRADEITLSTITIGELLAGFGRGTRAAANRSELQRFLDSPRVTLAPVDVETAQRYALIQVRLRESGTPIPTNDIWIAALAMQERLTVVTTDAHFRNVREISVAWLDPAAPVP
jgi:tRNA(fMet)-specific endonuclease VapC